MKQARCIHIAILALGGQGGGVLVDWIVALAMRAGWWAQATSVAEALRIAALLNAGDLADGCDDAGEH